MRARVCSGCGVKAGRSTSATRRTASTAPTAPISPISDRCAPHFRHKHTHTLAVTPLLSSPLHCLQQSTSPLWLSCPVPSCPVLSCVVCARVELPVSMLSLLLADRELLSGVRRAVSIAVARPAEARADHHESCTAARANTGLSSTCSCFYRASA